MLVESWIKTDMDQRSLVVAARLGDYSADNTGRAWFADVRMERADAVPDGELLILLTDYSQYQNDGGAEEIAAETEKTEAILPWALLFALAAAALWLLRGMQVSRPKLMIALLMALALILRVLLAVRYTGYETDNNCFYAWALAMANAGPNAFYDSVSFCDYPPGYLYLLWPVGALMNLLLIYFNSEIDELDEKNVCIRILGDVDGLPDAQRDAVNAAMARTKDNTGLKLNIALNYGGRDELLHAAKALAARAAAGEIRPEDITRADLEDALYTHGLPDVDLVIRTSGEMRLSNFLLYQIAYSEFVVTDTLWPDFDVRALHEAIAAYQKRDRRFGGVKTGAKGDKKA